jgi:mono/diheme cytochrome c family protein
MSYVHDLAYYGGNANNQSYLESKIAAKVSATVAPTEPPMPAVTSAQEVAAVQALLAQLKAEYLPVAAPAGKAKA